MELEGELRKGYEKVATPLTTTFYTAKINVAPLSLCEVCGASVLSCFPLLGLAVSLHVTVAEMGCGSLEYPRCLESLPNVSTVVYMRRMTAFIGTAFSML